jgi:hypothetical protein
MRKLESPGLLGRRTNQREITCCRTGHSPTRQTEIGGIQLINCITPLPRLGLNIRDYVSDRNELYQTNVPSVKGDLALLMPVLPIMTGYSRNLARSATQISESSSSPPLQGDRDTAILLSSCKGSQEILPGLRQHSKSSLDPGRPIT